MKITEQRLLLLKVLDGIDGEMPMAWLIKRLRPVARRAIAAGLVWRGRTGIELSEQGRAALKATLTQGE